MLFFKVFFFDIQVLSSFFYENNHSNFFIIFLKQQWKLIWWYILLPFGRFFSSHFRGISPIFGWCQTSKQTFVVFKGFFFLLKTKSSSKKIDDNPFCCVIFSFNFIAWYMLSKTVIQKRQSMSYYYEGVVIRDFIFGWCKKRNETI